MATTIPTLPVYTGKTPVIGQNQPEFNINRADKLAYDAQLFGENGVSGALNNTIGAMNTVSGEVEANAASAAQSAAEAEIASSSAGYKGEWYAGAPVDIGDIWGYQGAEWRALVNTSNAPVEGSEWRLLEKKPLNAIVDRASLSGSVYAGQRIEWLGHFSASDGGSNWGIVKFGPHVEDGGSIFSIDANTYIEANLKGKSISVAKFGYDFNAALAYLISLPNSKVSYSQMKQRDYILTMPTDTYEFDTGLIKRVASPTNPLSITIKGNGSTIKASDTYDGTRWLDLEHVVYFDAQDIKFEGFHTDWVIAINADQFINIEWARTPFENVTFIDCEYGINYAIESSNLTFDKVYFLGPKTIKAININRTDQISFNRCRFDWRQANRQPLDTLIDLNPDVFPTGEEGYPGGGRYNVPRISVRRSFFIPVGKGVAPVHTGWFGHYGGMLTIEDCHFGPESNNRPSVVINHAIGACYTGVTDITDSGIIIKNSSCVTSYDLIYCPEDYPNIIEVENIRWNVLPYQNPSDGITYYIGGDAAALNAKTRYGRPNAQYFDFKIRSGTPAYRALNDINPYLEFPWVVSSHSEFSVYQSISSNLPSTKVFYDLNNRNSDGEPSGQTPAVPRAGTYSLKHSVTFSENGTIKEFTMVDNLRLVDNNEVVSGVITNVVAAPVGSTPSATLTFIMPNGTEQSTVTRAEIDNKDRIHMRINYLTNNSSNTWQSTSLKMQRL